MKFLSITAIFLSTLVPTLSLTNGTRPAPSDKLLTDAGAALKALNGYECDTVDVRNFPATAHRAAMTVTEKLHVKFMRPNLFKITAQESDEPPSQEVSDGSSLYGVFRKSYYKSPIDPTSADFHWYHNDLLLFLLTGSFDKAVEAPYPSVTRKLPDEDVEGQPCKVVEARVPGGLPILYKIYIGVDGVPRKILHSENSGRPFTMEFSLSNFKPNPDFVASDFKFQPGPDIKPAAPFPTQTGEVSLIAVGAKAPEFSLPSPNGGRLTLSQALAGKKALLLNFWFVHCPPCRAEHPKLQKFFEEMKPAGLGLLAVDDQDSGPDVAKYMHGAGLRFQTVLSGPMAAVDPKTGEVNYRGPKLPDYASLGPFGVHECPTNILLDAKGRVVYVANSWDEAGLRAALAKLGVQ